MWTPDVPSTCCIRVEGWSALLVEQFGSLRVVLQDDILLLSKVKLIVGPDNYSRKLA